MPRPLATSSLEGLEPAWPAPAPGSAASKWVVLPTLMEALAENPAHLKSARTMLLVACTNPVRLATTGASASCGTLSPEKGANATACAVGVGAGMGAGVSSTLFRI